MPFPQIAHCIVCDTARPEAEGKIALLGFFGISPDVIIGIRDFARPVDLCFVFLVAHGGTPGQYPVALELLNSAGQTLGAPPAQPQVADVLVPPARNHLIARLQAKFPGPGRYRIRLIVSGAVHHEAMFELQPGMP